MTYDLTLAPSALKDAGRLSPPIRRRVFGKLQALRQNLAGDVKWMTNFTPEYRPRVGDYRVLFDIDGRNILVGRIVHRGKAYQ